MSNKKIYLSSVPRFITGVGTQAMEGHWKWQGRGSSQLNSQSMKLKWKFQQGGGMDIHDGGSDRASYCEPKKIHEPEILHPKNTWHQNFLPPKIQQLILTSMLIYSFTIKQTLDRSLDPQKKNMRL